MVSLLQMKMKRLLACAAFPRLFFTIATLLAITDIFVLACATNKFMRLISKARLCISAQSNRLNGELAQNHYSMLESEGLIEPKRTFI